MRIGYPLSVVLIALLSCAPLPAAEKPRVDFARRAAAASRSRCFSCHDGRKHKAGLRLDVRSQRPARRRVGQAGHRPRRQREERTDPPYHQHDDDEVMPPKGERLSAAQVKLLRSWIDGGAAWPDALAGDDPRGKNHWAFRPPVRPPLPAVKNGEVGAQPHRPLRPRPAGEGGPEAVAGGRPRHAAPPARAST